MKKTTLLATLGLAAAALFLGGCSTFESRANEKSAVFNALPEATQNRLELGKINVGDTEDLVYIALGEPTEKRQITRSEGTAAVWTYRTYYNEYAGSAWAGYRCYLVRTPRGYAVYSEPITQDVYYSHAEDRIRVAFEKGVVTAIDQRNT